MNPVSRTHSCSARLRDVQQMVLKGSRAIVRQADESLRSWTLMRFNIRDMTTIKKTYKLTTHATPSTRWPPVTDPRTAVCSHKYPSFTRPQVEGPKLYPLQPRAS